jgi:pimeloyl-ACP methyl ester carboxylesterase
MNPLYLGTAERRIFGIHEPAASNGGRPRAAVLCNPWGSEYIYAHRSMRQLAIKLSLCGYHTLRFDYFGTGDSAGEQSQTDLAGLQADVHVAIEALKDITEAPKVALIGLRVGANIAAHVASRCPAEVEALVLWDPILSGVLQDLGAFDLRPALDALPRRSLILVTEEQRSYEEVSRTRVASGATPAPIELITAPCPWIEAVTTTGALPIRVIQRIQEWLQ